MNWELICNLEDIIVDSGVAALIEGQQVAIFRVSDEGGEKFFGVGNYDPFSKANVISRGIVGSIGDDLVVASPIYKQHFNLTNGQCIEDETVCIGSWPIKVENGKLMIAVQSEEAAA